MNSRSFIVALAAAGLLAATTLAEDWPQFQGPRHDGTSMQKGLARSWPESGPPVRWTVTLEPGFGGAAIHGGEVFLMDRQPGVKDVIRCLDLATGRDLWRHEYEAPGRVSFQGSRGVPTVTGKHVYTIGPFGHVTCIDRASHEPVWSFRIPDRYDAEMPRWGWAQSPLLVGGVLVLAPLGVEVGLIGVDPLTGEERWRTGPLGSSHSTPTVTTLGSVEQVLFLTRRGEKGLLTSLDPSTGRILWESDAYTNRIPIPAPTRVDDDTLFITGGYEAGSLMLSVRKTTDGYATEELFRHPRGSQIHLPIVDGAHVYMLANENWNDRRRRDTGGLMCLDRSGVEQWRTGETPFFGRGPMLHADGMLIIQDGHDGTLRLVDPDPGSFRLLAEADLFGIDDRKDHQMWTPMALSEGHLVLRSQTELKCVDLRPASGASTSRGTD